MRDAPLPAGRPTLILLVDDFLSAHLRSKFRSKCCVTPYFHTDKGYLYSKTSCFSQQYLIHVLNRSDLSSQAIGSWLQTEQDVNVRKGLSNRYGSGNSVC